MNSNKKKCIEGKKRKEESERIARGEKSKSFWGKLFQFSIKTLIL